MTTTTKQKRPPPTAAQAVVESPEQRPLWEAAPALVVSEVGRGESPLPALPPARASEGEVGRGVPPPPPLTAGLLAWGCSAARAGTALRIDDRDGRAIDIQPVQHWDDLVLAAQVDVLHRAGRAHGLEAQEQGQALLFRLTRGREAITEALTPEQALLWLWEHREALEAARRRAEELERVRGALLAALAEVDLLDLEQEWRRVGKALSSLNAPASRGLLQAALGALRGEHEQGRAA